MDLEKNTFKIFLKDITIDNETFQYFDVSKINEEKYNHLPFSIRVLLESAVRNCDEFQVTSKDIKNILNWPETQHSKVEIQFLPSRVILQDFTGVPAIVDFAAMRDAMKMLGGDPQCINPICPADLVIDHSIQVDVAKKLIITVPTSTSNSKIGLPDGPGPGAKNNYHSLPNTNNPSQSSNSPAQSPSPLYNYNCSKYARKTPYTFSNAPSQSQSFHHNQNSRTHLNQRQIISTPTQKLNINNNTEAKNQVLVESAYKNCPFHEIRTECAAALEKNQDLEFERNYERFQFLKWGSNAFKNMVIVPPGSGIVHQVNLECLARVVFKSNNILYPDSLVGTDSHTTMINSLGIVGWGVGGIEAEAVMLGQAISMVLPQVVGYRISGKLNEMCTSTDVVLTITKHLRSLGVVNKFVEFFGPGVEQLSIADRATIANMCPEYGATIGYFAADEKAMQYLIQTGRSQKQVTIIREYLKAVNLFRDYSNIENDPAFSEIVDLDLATIMSCVSGPKRPQDKVCVNVLKTEFRNGLTNKIGFNGYGLKPEDIDKTVKFIHEDIEYTLRHGSVVIAAITSCTNTSNPSVMLAAGLLAKKACDLGLKVNPYIKTSLSPGSGVVTEYLTKSGMLPSLEQLGFNIVGYGCMTCIGNSGPLEGAVADVVEKNDLVACGVLSGNRNFEGRIHASTRANYLASPPLVIAYAIAGRVDFDFENEPLGYSEALGKNIYLKDIWPTRSELQHLETTYVIPEIFSKVYDNITVGNKQWASLPVPKTDLYEWDMKSNYIKRPPFFEGMTIDLKPIQPIVNAHALLYLGDSITTDHISPAGSIARNSPAAKHLMERGVAPRDFNSYGSRRGNDNIMCRGTFANIRLVNKLMGSQTGPKTVYIPDSQVLDIYDASDKYKQSNIPMIIIAGKEYGSGSSRDWAAKGPWILGVKAIIAESYERIHRSNLIGMGIIPLQFMEGESGESLQLTGKEKFVINISDSLEVKQILDVETDTGIKFKVLARVDTNVELTYLKHGGILNYMIRKFL